MNTKNTLGILLALIFGFVPEISADDPLPAGLDQAIRNSKVPMVVDDSSDYSRFAVSCGDGFKPAIDHHLCSPFADASSFSQHRLLNLPMLFKERVRCFDHLIKPDLFLKKRMWRILDDRQIERDTEFLHLPAKGICMRTGIIHFP